MVISHITDWRESRSCLGLETKSTESLGLAPVLYKILEVVSSRSRLGWKIVRQSRLGLVLYASNLLSLVSVSTWSGCVVLKNDKAKIQSFYSLKDGSCLGLVEKYTETLGLVSVLPEILSQVKSWSRIEHKQMGQSRLVQKISINYFLVLVS